MHAVVEGPKSISLEEKVSFLRSTAAYLSGAKHVSCRETHMSYVFVVGDRVFKLKKPAHFPYLNFSTLPRRETACRGELALNRRLAPDVYLDLVPLVYSPHGLSLGGGGEVVDWLVVMRRLDEDETLDHALAIARLSRKDLNRLVEKLVVFYRHARPVYISPERHFTNWRRSLAYNRSVLLDPTFSLPAGLVRRIDRAQRHFLIHHERLSTDRVYGRHIVDGHGDLRPEHIFLTDPIRIIDCLEFNAELRAADPFDEMAFLSLECERLGDQRASQYIKRRAIEAFGDGIYEELFTFYRCYRATLRARLAIAHLLECNPRTPEKWPRLARTYLRLAKADAVRLEQMTARRNRRPERRMFEITTPEGLSSLRRYAGAQSSRQTKKRSTRPRPCQAPRPYRVGMAARCRR
jgi:aminoglycoside phosphotransferase family enzyme